MAGGPNRIIYQKRLFESGVGISGVLVLVEFIPNRETIEKVRNYVFNYFYEASKVKMKTRQTLSFDYQKVLKVLQEDKDCEIPSDFTYAYKTKIHS
jgi:nitrate/TMAO reductase-like tetraheme cytochrome c subunit